MNNIIANENSNESYMDRLLIIKKDNPTEKVFETKRNKLLYIIEKNYFHYITNLANINDEIIKLDLIYFFQIVIIYYLNYELEFTKYNKLN